MPKTSSIVWKAERGTIYFSLLAALLFYSAASNLIWISWLGASFVIVAYLAEVVRKVQVRKSHLKTLSLGGSWLFLVILLTPFAYDRATHLKMILITSTFLFFSVIVILRLIRTHRLLSTLGYVFLAWVVTEGLLGLVYFLSHGSLLSLDGRFTGSYFNPNSLAVTGVFISSFLLVFRKHLCVVAQVLVLAALPLAVALVLSTGSVKGLVGLAFVGAGHTALRKGIRTRVLALLILVAASIIAATQFTDTNERFLAYTQNLTHYAPKDWDVAGPRQFLILEGLDLIAENPLTGIGVHNSQYFLYIPIYFIRDPLGGGTYSHNNYIEMALNGGLFAPVLYYTPVIFVFLGAWKYVPRTAIQDSVRTWILLAFATKFFNDIAMVSYYSFDHIFFCTLGFVLYLYFLRLEESPNDNP